MDFKRRKAAHVFQKAVDVRVMVQVCGALTPTGDVRELSPLAEAVAVGAADAHLVWTHQHLRDKDPARWDYSIQLYSTAKKPKRRKAQP